MVTKFTNALILTNADSAVFKGEIAIDNSIIKYVGEKYEGEYDNIVDCKGNLLMAGFIDCHAHAPMVLLKGLGEGESLEDWLFKNIVPAEKKLTRKDIYHGTVLAIKEMLKNGITCFQECYFYPDETLRACIDTGMRSVISLSQTYSLKDFYTIEKVEKMYNELKDKSSLVDFLFYFHSTYTCNEKQIIDTINLAKKYHKVVGTHMSETLTEVGNCTQLHGGLTPVGLLDSLGFFDNKCLVAHAVHLDKEDYQILENKNVSVVHNPSSNLKLGSGIANLKAMQSRGINICLGTDGSASNNKLDMFREMYLSSVLQKVLLSDAKLISPEQAIKMATENGAKALDNDKIGSLKVGNYADMIMIDMHSINNQVCNNIKSNLVYACGTEDVLMTMVNGKILFNNGEFTTTFLKNYK